MGTLAKRDQLLAAKQHSPWSKLTRRTGLNCHSLDVASGKQKGGGGGGGRVLEFEYRFLLGDCTQGSRSLDSGVL